MDDRPAADRQRGIWPACPFVDRNDNRCTSRFSLGRIDQAFDVCFGSYRACPMYHRITVEVGADVANIATERREHPRFPSSLITITAHGRALPLRPTGT